MRGVKIMVQNKCLGCGVCVHGNGGRIRVCLCASVSVLQVIYPQFSLLLLRMHFLLEGTTKHGL